MSLKVYSKAEITAHLGANPGDVWLVKEGRVLDVTKYVQGHPGGASLLSDRNFTDVTAIFNSTGHSKDAEALVETMVIGTLNASESVPSAIDAVLPPQLTPEQRDKIIREGRRREFVWAQLVPCVSAIAVGCCVYFAVARMRGKV